MARSCNPLPCCCSFQVACLQFLNKLAETAADRKERVHLQAEIEEAGFDVNVIKKVGPDPER